MMVQKPGSDKWQNEYVDFISAMENCARATRAEELAKVSWPTFEGAPIQAKLCKEYEATLKQTLSWGVQAWVWAFLQAGNL